MQPSLTTPLTVEIRRNCLLRMVGSPQNPTLFFLGGFGDNGTMFLPLFHTDLAKRYRLVAIDLPGTGASPAQPEIQTISDYGTLISMIIQDLKVDQPGLIGHSIASPIYIDTAKKVSAAGFFSIEGNLTDADAYFSGKAARFTDFSSFWTSLKADIRMLGADDEILRRYYGALMFADAEALWMLGKDAAHRGANNAFGKEFLTCPCKTHYFWSPDNTPDVTAQFITDNEIQNTVYNGSHWPTLDRTEETSSALINFFDQCFK